MRKVGIVSISDERQNANRMVIPIIKKQCSVLVELLCNIGDVQTVVIDEPINSHSAARKAGKLLAEQDVVATIFNLPTFGFPKYGVIASLFAPRPYMLIAQMDCNQPSPAGIAGLGGAFTQLGLPHERIWAELKDTDTIRKLEAFISAAATVNGLKGLVLGLIGGRSMGIYPMVSSSNTFIKKFGVDVDHIDQLEIIRKSEEVKEEQIDKAYKWLIENAGSVKFDNILTEKKLKMQICNYEAIKNIIKGHELDFIAAKCHYDMSEYQQPMCISAMFCNDPYDWNGNKDPYIFACEADEDGAMTMQILKLLSSGKPTCLLDMRYYDKNYKAYLFQNCGIAPSWFAGFSNAAKDNLKFVNFCSCVPKFKGGGTQADFWFNEGEYTLARLYQSAESYHMLIATGKAVPQKNVPDMPSGEAHWPKMAIKINILPDQLVKKLNCVHIHAVVGNYVEELKLVCKYLNIIPEIINNF